jgi:ACS family glucarate transporter-like MFS transporter
MNSYANKKYDFLWTSKRLIVLALLFGASFINYVDRVNMSVAAPAIAKEFGWNPATMGIVLSSFLWAYAAALIPTGWLTDKVGARRMNALAVSFWSAAGMLTGMANSFGMMVSTRLALGLGEAPTLPSLMKVIRQWFPIRERGLTTSLARSGAEAGPAIGMPLVALLVVKCGWRMSFLITGAAGFIWVALWLKYFRDKPQDSYLLSPEERSYIVANTDGGQKSDVKAIPGGRVRRLLRYKTMWGLALSHGLINYTAYLILTWIPSYLVQVKHMKLMGASLLSSAAFAGAWILGITLCKLSDSLLTPDKVVQGQRRIMVIVSALGASVFMATTVVDNLVGVLVILTIAKAFVFGAVGLNMALTNDLVRNPAFSASAAGILLFGGNSFGSMAPLVTGFIVKRTGSFDAAFVLAGVLMIMAALISYFMTRVPIEAPSTDDKVVQAAAG